MRHTAGSVTEEQFPESMQLDRENGLPLHYRFEPGHILDGITVTIPLSHLNRLSKAPFDHLVPGLIREKITWYFKALPKQIRRHLVPLPESVTQFLENLQPGDHSIFLTDLLAKFVHRKVGVPVSSNILEDKEPPLYLQMNYKVVDDAGRELAMNRDLAQLQSQLGQAAQLTFAQVDDEEKNSIERDNVMRWDFGDLPEEITFTRMGKQLTGYPALVDQQVCVAIRLFDTRQAAEENMRVGVRRLLRFELKDRMKQLEKNLPGLKQAVLQLTTLINPDELKQDMLTAITDRAFIGGDALPHNEKDFIAQKQRARTRLPAVIEALAQIMQKIGCEVQALLQRLSASGMGNERLRNELNIQLRHLLFPGFLSVTLWERLQHYPRYLKGMHMRLEKFCHNPQRDGQHSTDIISLWNQYVQRMEKHRKTGNHDPNLVEFRWQIEELRISLFAQELKTPAPVSVKRLQKLWEKVRE